MNTRFKDTNQFLTSQVYLDLSSHIYLLFLSNTLKYPRILKLFGGGVFSLQQMRTDNNNLCVFHLQQQLSPTDIWLTFGWTNKIGLFRNHKKRIITHACCLCSRIANIVTMNVQNTISTKNRRFEKDAAVFQNTHIGFIVWLSQLHLLRLCFGGIHWLNSYSAKFSFSSFHAFNNGSFT